MQTTFHRGNVLSVWLGDPSRHPWAKDYATKTLAPGGVAPWSAKRDVNSLISHDGRLYAAEPSVAQFCIHVGTHDVILDNHRGHFIWSFLGSELDLAKRCLVMAEKTTRRDKAGRVVLSKDFQRLVESRTKRVPEF